MKMNEKHEWTIYKYIKKNEQITNIYIRNQRKLKPYILGINQRLPNSTQNTRRCNLTAISRPPRGFTEIRSHVSRPI